MSRNTSAITMGKFINQNALLVKLQAKIGIRTILQKFSFKLGAKIARNGIEFVQLVA